MHFFLLSDSKVFFFDAADKLRRVWLNALMLKSGRPWLPYAFADGGGTKGASQQGALWICSAAALCFHLWNLDQSSAEKRGLTQLIMSPFQEVVTSPLPAPLGAEQKFCVSVLAGPSLMRIRRRTRDVRGRKAINVGSTHRSPAFLHPRRYN